MNLRFCYWMNPLLQWILNRRGWCVMRSARLRSSQRTIVICTHNLAEAEALADIIAIIYKGHILMAGTLEELKQRILGTSEYEAKFSSSWNADGLKLPAGVVLTEQNEYGLRFKIENPKDANPVLLGELASMQAPLFTFQEVPRSLEEVYLRVMADAKSPVGELAYAG